MSETVAERKKQIDDIVDLLDRAKACMEEMKSSDESDLEALREEAAESEEGDADALEDTEEMQTIAAGIENLDSAIDAVDDAIDYVTKAE
jgi:hypothetical protein